MDLPQPPKIRRRRYGVRVPAPDANNPARCALYCRCSRSHQELSIPAQLLDMRARCAELGLTPMVDRYNGPIDNMPDANPTPVPGVFTDQAVSAYTLNLTQRPAGRRMLMALRPGDTVMCSRLDRMFRSVTDFIVVSNWLTERGIRLFVSNPRIDLATATGRLLARHIASLAEWESDRKSERIREGLANKRKRGSALPRRERTVDLGSDYRPPTTTATPYVERKRGRIFIYLRVSHRDSVASGLMAQMDIAKAYMQSLIAANPDLTFVKDFCDPAQSAWKHDLKNRPSGGAMCDMLQPGDHVVFATLDRGFRSIKDLANTIPDWQDRGITAHFVGEGINLADVGGRMLAMSIVQFAQWEAEITSARNREARAVMVAAGKYVGGRPPVFRRVIRYQKHRQLTLDRDRLVQFRLLQAYRRHKIPLPEALTRLESLLAKREGRVAIPLTGVHRNSKLSSLLPKDYERDEKGRAFPVWTRGRYYEALKSFQTELENWRRVVIERRKLAITAA